MEKNTAESSIRKYLQEHVLDQELIDLNAKWRKNACSQDEFLTKFETLTFSSIHKTHFQKTALHSISSGDSSIKNDNLLRFEDSFEILSAIISNRMEALGTHETQSKGDTVELKNFLLRIIDLLCKLLVEIEIWDTYALHAQLARFLEYCIDLDYVFALLNLTCKLLTFNEHGETHYLDFKKNMEDLFVFLLPIFSLLESQKNNLQSIGSQMKNWQNPQELTDLISSTLKIAAPSTKNMVTALIDALANIKISKEDFQPFLAAEQLKSLPVFSTPEFLKVLSQQRRQKYFIIGIVTFMELLSNEHLLIFTRNTYVCAALAIKSAILIQGDVNKDFIAEFGLISKVNLNVSWTNVYDINALTKGLKSLSPDDLTEKQSLQSTTNLLAGKLMLYLTSVILNPFHYKCVFLDQDPLTALEKELFRMYKEPPKKSFMGKFCGSGAQRNREENTNKPGIEELIDQIIDQLKKYLNPQSIMTSKINVPIQNERTAVRYFLAFLASVLEIFAAPNKFLMSTDKKGKSKLTLIVNSLVLLFSKYADFIQDYIFEFPQLLKLFAQSLGNYPFVLNTLPKGALVELVQQYSKLFFRLLTSKIPNSDSEAENDQAITNAIGSFLLLLSPLPASELREEIIKVVLMPELSSPQIFVEKKRAVKLHFTLAFANICFSVQKAGNINTKVKIAFPIKNMEIFLKLSGPSLTTLPLAVKLSQESAVARDIMLENGFFTDSTSNALAPAKIWYLSSSNRVVFEYFLNITEVLKLFMKISEAELRNKLVIGLLGAVQNAAEGLDINLNVDYKYCVQDLGNNRLLFSKIFYNCYFKDCYLLLLRRAMETAKSWPDNKGDKIAQVIQQHTALAWSHVFRLPLFLVRKTSFESLNLLFRYSSIQEKFEFLWKIYENSKLESLNAHLVINCFATLHIDPKSQSIDLTCSLYRWLEANKSTANEEYETYLRFLGFFVFCETITLSLRLEKVPEISVCCTSEDFIRLFENKLNLITLLPKYITLLDQIITKTQNLLFDHEHIEKVRGYVRSFAQYLFRFIIIKSRNGDIITLEPYFDLWKGRLSEFLKIKTITSSEDLTAIQTDMLVFEIIILESVDQVELITLFGKHSCLRYLSDAISKLVKLYCCSDLDHKDLVMQVIHKSIIKGFLKLLLKANIGDLNSISSIELEKTDDFEAHWQSYIENILIFISSSLELIFKPAEDAEKTHRIQKLFTLCTELSVQFLQNTFVPLLDVNREIKFEQKKSISEKHIEFLQKISGKFLAPSLRKFVKDAFAQNSNNLIYLAKEQRVSLFNAMLIIADLLKEDSIHIHWGLELKEGCEFLQLYTKDHLASNCELSELEELQHKLEYWFELAGRVREPEAKIGFWTESLNLALRTLSIDTFSSDPSLELFCSNLILLVLNESINSIKTMSKESSFTQKYSKELNILLDLVLRYLKTVTTQKIRNAGSLDPLMQSSAEAAVVLKILAIFTVLSLEYGFDFKYESLFKEYGLMELQGAGEDHCIFYILAAILKNDRAMQLSLEQIIDAKVLKYNNLFSILSDPYLLNLFDTGKLTEEALSITLKERYETTTSESFSKTSPLTHFDLMKVQLIPQQGAKHTVVSPDVAETEFVEVAKIVTSHIQKLCNQIHLSGNMWPFEKPKTETSPEVTYLFKLVQMIRMLTELIKLSPKFAIHVLSTQIQDPLLFSGSKEPKAGKNVTIDLATLLVTSILPIVPIIAADNFLESLCSYHQTSFLVQDKDSVVTNDWYFAKWLGTTLFDSLRSELEAVTHLYNPRSIERSEAYTLLLQSIFKNVEYRTKEQTDFLSKKVNELLDSIFIVWEKNFLNNRKNFLKLVHNIYILVQDSTLLTVQRFFFGEDYKKFLHQYTEDLETMSKQLFSSNIDFSKFIESKHSASPHSVSDEGKAKKPPINQNTLVMGNTQKKPSIALPDLFEQNLGEDLQHIKLSNSQQEFTRELNLILNSEGNSNLNAPRTNRNLENTKFQETICQLYGLNISPDQGKNNPIDYIKENLSLLEVDSKEQQNYRIKEELLTSTAKEFSLHTFFGTNLSKGLKDTVQKVNTKLSKILEYSMCDRFEKLLSKGRFDTHLMAKMGPEPKINEFIEQLPVKQIIAALALVGNEYYFLLSPNFRGLSISIKQKIKEQNLQSALQPDTTNFANYGPHSLQHSKETEDKYLRPALESVTKTAQLILQSDSNTTETEIDYKPKLFKSRLNKRFKSNCRHIYDQLEKKCENYDEMVYYLNRTECARRSDAIAIAEENIIKINSKNIERLLITGCYLQAVAPHEKEPYYFFEILLDLCVQPINQIQVLDAVFSMLKLIENKEWRKYRSRSKMLSSTESKEAPTFEYLLQFLLCVARSLKSQLFLANNFGQIVKSVEGYSAPLPYKLETHDPSTSEIKLYLFDLVKFLKASYVTPLSNEKCGEIFIRVCLGLQNKAHLFSEQFKAVTSQELLYDKSKFKFSFQISNVISQNMKHIGNNPSLLLFAIKNDSFLKIFQEELFKVISLFMHSKASLEQLMVLAKKRSRGLIMGFFDNLQIFRKEEDFVVSISVSLFYIDRASAYLKSVTAGLVSLTKQMQSKKEFSLSTLNEIEKELKQIMANSIIVNLYKWCNETLLYYAELRKELTVLDSAFFKTLGNQSIQNKRYASLRGIFGFIIQVFDLNNKSAIFKNKLKNFQAGDKNSIEEEELEIPVLRRLKTKTEEAEEEKNPEQMNKINIEEKKEAEAMKIDQAFTTLSTVGKSLIAEMFTHDVGALESNAIDPIFIAPWLFTFTTKKQMIQAALKKKTLLNEIFNIQAAAAEPGARKFLIRREHILEDTLNNIEAIPEKEINHELKFTIEYQNEVGQDLGGLTNEWLNEVISKLLDPKFGLFQIAPNKISIQPSPLAYIVPNYLKYFRLAGRLIGYSVANAITLKVSFTKPFLKLILDVDVSASDLNDIDTELYRSLQWMLENSVEGVLGQDYAYEVEAFGKYYTINITPDGRRAEVGDANKKEFVKSLAYSKLVQEIDEPLKEFKKGMFEIVPHQLLKILLPSELLTLLAGEARIDVKEMRKFAVLQSPPSVKVTNWFWEVVEEFDQDQLSNLMFFITGHSNVAVGGFQEHPIKISRSNNSKDSLPISHTCFNMIHLPEYSSKEMLRERIIKAMVEGKGFYLA